MSLKKFVMSGIQDVLENKLLQGNRGQQQPQQPQDQGHTMNQGGYYGNQSGGYAPPPPGPDQSAQPYPPSSGMGGYPSQPGGYPPPQQGYQPPPSQYGSGYSAPAAPYQMGQYKPDSMASEMLGTPSVRPVPNFNANQDAETLRKAMKGLGCNNAKVISVLCGRTNWQRQEIAKAFKVMYGKDLIRDLKSELSGDFEDLILALMEPTAVYDAKQLHKAMQGLGTKESVLIEIMTSRTNSQIAEIRNVYQQLYRTSLESDLIGDTSGCFQRLLVSLCAGGRDESNRTDPLRANQDARKLYSAGERRLGTDESCFNAILASNNFNQLRLIFDEYQKVTNHSIEKAIEAEFSGDVKDGLLAVIAVARNRPAYFAKLLYESMKGFGTRDSDLIRLVVTRCEYDMVDIRSAFQAMYKTTLENMIKGDCSGAYKDGLIALVTGNAH
uniref:Annexin n=1 Tax=Haemonchus contortus TaxID=6289 RepID=A0A7I4YFY7_HAECO